MRFLRTAKPPEKDSKKSYYFCFSENDILINKTDEAVVFPLIDPDSAAALGLQNKCFIGMLEDITCYTAEKSDRDITAAYKWSAMREIYLDKDEITSGIAGYAKQIFNWNRNFRFCGRCGAETVKLETEFGRECKTCSLINYPRISPAVIAAVIKDDKILLARGKKFPDKKMYSVLAGYLEPGESLEDCVEREIFEEVGVKVKNIKYFQSQSWPFPDTLMLGFTAEYESGKIRIDEDEISEAGWYSSEDLPKVPTRRSISSELIKWFKDSR